MKTHGYSLIRLLIAPAVGLGLILAPAGISAAKKIEVPPPPPPPEAKEKPAGKFDYPHQIKKVQRDRKPVVALLRPGDVVELAEYLPFGRGIGITDTNPDGTKSQTVIKTGREDAPVLMPAQIRQFLTRELLDTGEFIVLERERILEIARELALAKTQAVDPQSAPRPGHLIGVHFILEGSYYPVGGLPADDPALEPVRREAAKRNLRIDPTRSCVMYLTVYKVETGEVKAVACGADFRPMIAVKRAVEDLVDQLGQVVEPIKVAKVDVRTGLALLDVGAQDGVKPGDVFKVATAPPGTATPEAAREKGVSAEVLEVSPLTSVVKLPEGDKAAVKEGQVAFRSSPEKAADTKPPAPDKPKDDKAATPKEQPAAGPAEKKPADKSIWPVGKKPEEKP